MTAAAGARVAVPTERGELRAELDASWSRRDASEALVPALVLIHDPRATSLADLPPVRLGLRVEGDF